MDLDSLETINNKDKNRFELEVDGKIAFIDYKVGKSGKWYLVHTEVPKGIETRGVGHKLVRESLEMLDEQGEKIVPSCPFVRKYIKDHPGQYEHMLAEGFEL